MNIGSPVVIEENNKVDKPKRVCKFRPINLHTADIFTDKRLFFGSVEDFNDPFEYSMNLSNTTFQKREPVIYHSFRNAFVILSVCDEVTKYDPILWSHYANNHKGVCIEFTPNYKNEKSPFFELEPVTYSSKIPRPRTGSRDDVECYLKTILKTKAKCWEYEKEWRVVRLNNDGEEVVEALSSGMKIDKGRFFTFDPSELTKITLGCQVSLEDTRVVMNWARELENYDIIIEKCFMDKTEFRLNLKQII